jgi:hypothetical protein
MSNMAKDWRFEKSPHVEQGGLRESSPDATLVRNILTVHSMQVHTQEYHYVLRPNSANM